MPEWARAPWLNEIWQNTYPKLPQVGIALGILIGGWILAAVLSRVIFAALRRTTIDDKIAQMLGYETGGEHGARVERVLSKTIYYLLLVFVAVAFFGYLGIAAVTAPLVTVLDGFAGAVPSVLKAVVIGFAGFLLATGARKLIVAMLTKVDFDGRMKKLGGEDEVVAAEVEDDDGKKKKKKKKARDETPLAETLGDVAYWFILVVAAIPVLEALKIGVLAAPLSAAFAAVTTYLPKVAAAAILLVVGYVLARAVRAIVSGVLSKVGVDRAVARLGFGGVAGEHPLSGILGAIAMAFVLLHFAISAVGRLEIAEISTPLRLMLEQIYVYLPKLLVGAVLMAIGVVVARVAGNVAARLLAAMGFNTLMGHIGVYKATDAARQQERESKALMEKRMEGGAVVDDADDDKPDELFAGGTGLHTPADVAGVVVGALIVLLFLRQVLGTMGLEGLAQLLDRLIAYLPNAIVAMVVVGAGLWAGNWAHQRVDELTRQSTDRLVRAMGSVAHVAIVAFTIMIALGQLGVGRQLISIAFALVLGSVCLAAALAFGLGGRDVASKILEKEYSKRQGPR